jgi:phosphopantothenoylcysteine decarboxylase/phosphopantothenate--cysteine ligase
MFSACDKIFSSIDIAVMSAAVADFTPANVAGEKIKKQPGNFELGLTQTKDILQHIGKHKRPDQYIVGFALETNNEKENALAKLRSKNADCIILNSLRDADAGFGVDTNKVTILEKSGKEMIVELKSKKEVAKDIVSFLVSQLHAE